MANIGRGLVLRLAVNTGPLGSGLASAAGMISTFAGKTKGAIGGIFSGLGGFGRDLAGITFLKDTVTGLLGEPLRLAGEFETAKTSFGVLLGDMQKGEELMGQLAKFGAETPFELPEVQDAAKALLAFGVDSDKLIPTLTAVGNASALTGKDFKELAVIFGQVKSKGRLMGDDWLQLASAGMGQLKPLISQIMGIQESQFEKVKEQGLITFDVFAEAFRRLTSGSGPFAGGMEKLSQTLLGKWSTLKDGFSAVLRGVGQAAVEGLDLKGLMDDASGSFEWIAGRVKDWLVPAFSAVGGIVRGLIEVFRELWTTAIKPWIEGLSGGLTDNKDRLKSWRDWTIDTLEAVTKAFDKLGQFLTTGMTQGVKDWIATISLGFSDLARKLSDLYAMLGQRGPALGWAALAQNMGNVQIGGPAAAGNEAAIGAWFAGLRGRLGAGGGAGGAGGGGLLPELGGAIGDAAGLKIGKAMKGELTDAMEYGTQKAWETIQRTSQASKALEEQRLLRARVEELKRIAQQQIDMFRGMQLFGVV